MTGKAQGSTKRQSKSRKRSNQNDQSAKGKEAGSSAFVNPASFHATGAMHAAISPELRPFQEETVRSRLRKEFYPFTNNQLKELLQQYDMYIQLLYQVLLFDESQNGNKGPGTGAATCQGKKSAAAATSFKTMLDLKQ